MKYSFRFEALEFCFEALESMKISSGEPVSSQKYKNRRRTKICDSTVYDSLYVAQMTYGEVRRHFFHSSSSVSQRKFSLEIWKAEVASTLIVRYISASSSWWLLFAKIWSAERGNDSQCAARSGLKTRFAKFVGEHATLAAANSALGRLCRSASSVQRPRRSACALSAVCVFTCQCVSSSGYGRPNLGAAKARTGSKEEATCHEKHMGCVKIRENGVKEIKTIAGTFGQTLNTIYTVLANQDAIFAERKSCLPTPTRNRGSSRLNKSEEAWSLMWNAIYC